MNPIPRWVAVLAPALIAALVVVVPSPSHAAQRLTGTITAADPSATSRWRIDNATSGCGPERASWARHNYDHLNLPPAAASGPRTFTVRFGWTGYGDRWIYVYRNGVCVGARQDQTGGPDSLTVARVPYARGDTIVVQIAAVLDAGEQKPWTLDVVAHGQATGPASGKATRYAALPAAITCTGGRAVATLTTQAKRALRARKVRVVRFVVGKREVAAVHAAKPRQVRRAIRHGVRLTGLPRATPAIKVVVTGKRGQKARAVRGYDRC